MLINLKVSGFKSFDSQIELNLSSNNCSENGKRLFVNDNTKVNKTAIIYGGNNCGKTNIIDSLKAFKFIFNEGSIEKINFERYKNFSINEDEKVSFEITFSADSDIYTYGVEFADKKEIEEYLFFNDVLLFSKSSDLENYSDISLKHFTKEDHEQFKRVGKTKLFVRSYLETVDENVNYHIKSIETFFKKIEFFDASESGVHIGLAEVLFKNEDVFELYNKLITAADVRLEGKIIDDEGSIPAEILEYLEEVNNKEESKVDDEKFIRFKKLLNNHFKIKSVYKKLNGENKVVDADKFDSVGTERYSQLILLIIDSVINNKVLFIDEIDNSLHFRLTREIIKFMNSSYNNGAQFIFTAHDVKLLRPELFNKEQVNFIDCCKETLMIEMFSLAQFKANTEKDLRNDSNFEKKYVSGKFGALPEPDLIEVVMQWQEK